MLKEIAIVTITVANLGQVEQAWQEEFGYVTTDKGTVSAELSRLWDAPAMQGAEFVTMLPANDAEPYIRFVEDEAAADYRPMTSHGWNATELLVRNTDAVAEQLRESADHELLRRILCPRRHVDPLLPQPLRRHVEAVADGQSGQLGTVAQDPDHAERGTP